MTLLGRAEFLLLNAKTAKVGGAALAGAISLVTSALNHRWSERARSREADEGDARAIRDQRREACHRYLVATNSFYQAVDQVYRKGLRDEEFDAREHAREAITTLQDTYVYLTISTGSEVRELARAYNRALYALEESARYADSDSWASLEPQTHRARDHLRAAMRAELGIAD
jgi:hypothetical protein